MATIWEKLNKRPTSIKRPSSSPEFEISAPGANSRIYGEILLPGPCRALVRPRPRDTFSFNLKTYLD